ncbi:MAG TPA: cytochrome c biogenesis protein CcsA [Acidimicrobiales bacterium]|nr:cytochrome c biogenesis protein CcsA [Acidimicrobiales bacterium]
MTTTTAAERTTGPSTAPAHTGSPASRVLGIVAAAGVVALFVMALAVTPADEVQGEAVRMLYIHVPAAISMYVCAVLLGVASALWLRRRTRGWDVLAAASAEVGLVFTVLVLVTGMLWGRPTWGVYWVWDARLTSTALLAVLLAGYLALRRVPADPVSRSRRSAIAGLLLVVDLPIIKWSVDWWRTLHQDETLTIPDAKIDGIMLFTLFLGLVVGVLVTTWLLVHRFRVAWLEEEVEQGGLDVALAERRAEAG